MSDNVIREGDRVSWRSRRVNRQGSTRRTGIVLKIYAFKPGSEYAYLRPDKGYGRLQHISLRRLNKIDTQEPTDE